LKVLVSDERSMFGRTTMGWMEQHARYGMNRENASGELWGGIPVVVMMVMNYHLFVIHKCMFLILEMHLLTMVDWFGRHLIAL